MPQIDYEKYLVRKPNYEAFGGTKNRQSPTMTMMSNKQIPGVNYYMEPGWIYGIPDPNPSLHEHVHEYDEIVMHWGGDYRQPQVLGGEIEFWLGGQPITFNTTTALYIPKGTPHGPVIWKKFDFPHMQMAIMCGTGEAGTAWDSSGIKVSKDKMPVKTKDFDYEQYVVRSPLREAAPGFVGRTSPTMTMMSGVQVPGCRYYIDMAWTYGVTSYKELKSNTPEIAYKTHDQIAVYIGGNSLHPEDLGGEVEVNMEGQKLKFDTTSALFIPHGVRHGPRRVTEYSHPHLMISIMSGAASLKEVRDDAVIYPSQSQPEEKEFK
jgi:quercetin dioxygenase-like cupin family protein